MSAICDRLRAAREGIGLNQQKFGALGGVSRNAQFTYESGKRAPDAAYLVSLEQHGIDAGYILTGRRAFDSLAPHLSAMVNTFERMAPNWQQTISALIVDAADASALLSARPPASPESFSLPREEVLVEMFSGLLKTIDPEADLAEQARLLARRLPIGLSQVQDVMLAEDQPDSVDLEPAAPEDHAKRRHAPTR